MPRRRVYDVPEEEFRCAVSESLSLREIIRTIDLHDHTNTYKRLRQRIDELELDTSHFHYTGRRPRSFTEEQLKEAVAASRSIRQTLLALGIRAEGGNYKTLRRDIEKLGIDTSHFTGQGWRRGDSRPMIEPRPLREVLVEDSQATTSLVRRRLLREGLIDPRCHRCGIKDWMGQPLTVELDHINGISNDHRLENLRMLCPNCHSQTDTFRARNLVHKRAPIPTQLGML